MNDILITKINNKEESALKEIFNEMFHKLHFYSFKITSDWHSSEDIVLNVFIKFWNRGKPYNGWNEAKRILFIYTKNESINLINGIRGKLVYVNEIDDSDPDDNNDIDYDILRVELVKNIVDAFAILPKQCQEVMYLYKEGLSARQIASKLGISENTVYNQYRRSIIKLKKHFNVTCIIVLL